MKLRSWPINPRKLLLEVSIFLALIFTVPHYMVTTNGAYHLAVATAHQTPQFNEMLGAPIREAWFSDGKEVWSRQATAEFLIPVRGRIRNGNLRVLAIKNDRRWILKELSLELAHPDQRIDLLSNTGRLNHDEGRP